MKKSNFLLLSLLLLVLVGCGANKDKEKLSIAFEEYTLDNGLKVVLHQDNSDPVVAQAITFHVGSAREKEGKTGFAHFFEHMLFQRSENLPRNSFFTKIADMGGDFNGGTSNDYTIYYEAVPRNALEKILWMESDRMGYFINTVTQSGLEREIDVICNEKRQTEVNNPYGMMNGIMCKELYPKGHPYSWTVIGEFEDVKSATIEDVKEFYANYYVPSNATLCIAGDIDIEETKALIEKYFAEIPSHPVSKPQVWNVTLDNTKEVYYEDQFASMPAVDIAFPTVAMGHEDEAALDVLSSLFGRGKNSPLYKCIVEKHLAPSAGAYNGSRESAGEFNISVNAFPGVDIDAVMDAIEAAKEMFETNGVDLEELATLKVSNETSAYRRMSSVLGKAQMLSQSKEFYGKADQFVDDIEAYNNVTAEDVMRVYNKYIKDAHYVAVIAVPAGQKELSTEGSTLANIVMEDQTKQTMRSQAGAIVDDDYERTPSKIDRSVEPDYMANTPQLNVPQIWESTLANGIEFSGITNTEVPMVQFDIIVKGGALLDPAGKRGVAFINANMMNEGTASKTAVELEQALKKLGTTVSVGAGTEITRISVTTLKKNIVPVMEIVNEMITAPRFDEAAFDRAIKSAKSRVANDATRIATIGSQTLRKLYFGESILSETVYGTVESLDAIALDDVKNSFGKLLSAKNAFISVAGDITAEEFANAASVLNGWSGEEVAVPAITIGNSAKPGIYFVDYPGSKQSYITIAGPGTTLSDDKYAQLIVLNNKLGEDSNGRLFDVLRLQRGYTYGAYSSFDTDNEYGMFNASSSVQGSATKESVGLFTEIFNTYGPTFTQEMLDATKGALVRGNASRFETIGSLVSMLNSIKLDNMPKDYIVKEEAVINATTLEDVKSVAEKYLDTDNMIYVVVGDAKTQLKSLKGAKLIEK